MAGGEGGAARAQGVGEGGGQIERAPGRHARGVRALVVGRHAQQPVRVVDLAGRVVHLAQAKKVGEEDDDVLRRTGEEIGRHRLDQAARVGLDRGGERASPGPLGAQARGNVGCASAQPTGRAPLVGEEPERLGVVVARHHPVFGRRVLGTIHVALIVDVRLLRDAKAPEAVPIAHPAQRVGLRAEHLAEHVALAAPARGGGLEHDVEERRVARHLRLVEPPHSTIGVARDRAIDLLGPSDGRRGELGVIGLVGRLEEPRAALHRRERVGRIGAVDPGANQAVRVIEAHPVVVAQHRQHAPTGKTNHRARRAVALEVERGVEHRVVPGLPLGVGAARRRAHRVVAQEERAVRPDVANRVADLQIAEELDAPIAELEPQPRVLLARHELPEGEALELDAAARLELAQPLRARPRLARPRSVEPAVGRQARPRGPAAPVDLPVLAAEGLVNGSRREPLGLGLAEGPERLVRGPHGLARRPYPAALDARAQGRVGLVEQTRLRPEGILVAPTRRPPLGNTPVRRLERRGGQQAAPALAGELVERKTHLVARKDGAVIRRRVALGRQPLGPELQAVEAEGVRKA